MACPIYFNCCGCSCACPAFPLMAEDLRKLKNENREIYEGILSLRGILIYCARDAIYKFVQIS
jgi:hypothetical protein